MVTLSLVRVSPQTSYTAFTIEITLLINRYMGTRLCQCELYYC